MTFLNAEMPQFVQTGLDNIQNGFLSPGSVEAHRQAEQQFSEMPTNVGAVNNPVGNAYRGFGSDWFNAGSIAREDWLRNEQSADLAFERSLKLMENEQMFNSAEAEKNRQWQEKMSNSTFQRAVADLKAAGLNPILAYSSLQGAQNYSGSTASAGSVSLGSANNGKGISSQGGVSDVMKILSGFIGNVANAGASAGAAAAKIALALA